MKYRHLFLSLGILVGSGIGQANAAAILNGVMTGNEDITLSSAALDFNSSSNVFTVSTATPMGMNLSSVTLRNSGGTSLFTDPNPASQTFISALFQNTGSVLSAMTPGFVAVNANGGSDQFFANLELAGFASGEIQFIAVIDKMLTSGQFATTFDPYSKVSVRVTAGSGVIPTGADIFGEGAGSFTAMMGVMVDIKGIVPTVPAPATVLMFMLVAAGLACRSVRGVR